jgi:NADH-quinone oxidoreductase subunit J
VNLDPILFYLFAGIAIGASLVVIGQRNPMYSVLSLIASFIGLAGIYVLLDSPFAAVTQIIVYAGAIMVLFLFVVMLLNAAQEEPPTRRTIPIAIASRPLRIGVILGLVFLVQIMWALARVPSARIEENERIYQNVSSVRQIGIELFTTHAFAFEVTSVLILVAILGAIVLAHKEID